MTQDNTSQWHRFECSYIATKQYQTGESKMMVTDWIDTGAQNISINSVGHFWAIKGYIITNQEWHEINITPGELNAKIVFLS